MGEKDISERTLEEYNDVFADIVNVLLFHGERRVSEDALEDVQSFSQYKADDNKLHEQERDVAKIWKNTEFRIALFGVEDQTIEKREGGHGKMESYFTVMFNKGMNQGIEKERKEVNDLIRWLREQGREEDLWKSLDDPELQDRLIEEMHAEKGDFVTV